MDRNISPTSASNTLSRSHRVTSVLPNDADRTSTCRLQKSSGVCETISRCLCTAKFNVGVWHGPYEMTLASRCEYRPWKNLVWNLVNATPTLRSSSCLASTASASSRLGAPSVLMARSMDSFDTALNLALCTNVCPTTFGRITGAHASITSKHMFSPSLSQSSQRMRCDAPFASRSRCSTTRALGVASFFCTGASNKMAGSRSQD
mmetsp:Transcript_11343/g.45782  ORF Transcript_11343/g.45782 Transcript_11343/m.45782 type:complete len:205 (+) Transcript_11343:1829-2443(+)